MISGCAVGATLAAKGGPSAACIGCVGFAGFSLVVDKIMGPH
jgi:import inner membrane translocase subunit TIM22